MKLYMILGLLALALLGTGCCNPPTDSSENPSPYYVTTGLTYTDVGVIEYFSTFLIADELILAGKDGACTEQHWHSKEEIIALSGTPYFDPAPVGCGFCTLKECPEIVEFFERDCFERRNCIF